MESRLINNASGNTIKEVLNPIRWLFNHDREVIKFTIQILQDGGGLLIAYLDTNTTFRMTWADHNVMIDRLFQSRAWRNHFFQTVVTVKNTHGAYSETRIIK